ncbi:unnamed protein product [Gordionus sp. m RMFG-2023]|uniref:uncharacterized protein LOC135925760 n=1 Tax=Gordionus sp. m RMFG-2023 TaxID=3053472 RepID=UPI0030DF8FB7
MNRKVVTKRKYTRNSTIHESSSKSKLDKDDRDYSNNASVTNSPLNSPYNFLALNQGNKDFIFHYTIPDKLKDRLAQEFTQINIDKTLNIFNNSTKYSKAQQSRQLTDLTIEGILSWYLDTKLFSDLSVYGLLPISTNMDDLDFDSFLQNLYDDEIALNISEALEVDIVRDDKESLTKKNAIKDFILAEQERLEFVRGLRIYFDKLFDKKLLYKNEKALYNKFKSTSLQQNDNIKSNDPNVNGINSKPSNYLQLDPFLRLFVILPEMINQTDLNENQIRKLSLMTQDFLDCIGENI